MLGLLFATITGEFHLRASRSHRRRDRAADTIIALREIDGLEWRVIAGRDPEQLSEQISIVAAELRASLESVVGPTEGDVALSQRSVVYTLAIEDELTAMVAGNTELAHEIDETRVDPAFDLAIDRAKSVVELESAAADRTDRNMRRLIKATTALTVIGGGLAAWLLESRRRRSREREGERRRDLHFRSLIESSSDVITTVTGEGQLNQISPQLGRFSEIVRGPRWERVTSLLGDGEPYERWRRADIELQQSGTTDPVTLELVTPAGLRMHIEAIGTMLAGSTTERVWVWRDVSARRELELQLSHLAFHDPLTGMANRAHFVDRANHSLRRAAKDGEPTSILFCDLDDFKKVNDSYGHEAGDELLGIVGERLRGCMRPRDTIARIGGDEFVVLLENTDTDGALAFARRVQQILQQEAVLRAGVVRPSASIGVASAGIGTTIEDLLRQSDQAMYAVKGAGKGYAATFQD